MESPNHCASVVSGFLLLVAALFAFFEHLLLGTLLAVCLVKQRKRKQKPKEKSATQKTHAWQKKTKTVQRDWSTLAFKTLAACFRSSPTNSFLESLAWCCTFLLLLFFLCFCNFLLSCHSRFFWFGCSLFLSFSPLLLYLRCHFLSFVCFTPPTFLVCFLSLCCFSCFYTFTVCVPLPYLYLLFFITICVTLVGIEIRLGSP